MRLWLDDVRRPPRGWVWADTAEKAIAILAKGEVKEVSLDYDLAPEHYAALAFGKGTGEEVATFIAGMANPPEVILHTLNPAGRERMRALLTTKVPSLCIRPAWATLMPLWED